MVALSIGKDGALYNDRDGRVPFSGNIVDEALWRGTGVNPLAALSATSGITRIGERLGKEFGGDNLGNVEFTQNDNGEDVYRFSVSDKIPQDKVAAALGLTWNAVMPLHRDDRGRIVYEVTSRDAARALHGAGIVTATRTGATDEQSVDVSDVRQYLLDCGLDPDQFEVRQYGGLVRIVPKGQTDFSARDESPKPPAAPADKSAQPQSEFRIVSTPAVQFTPQNAWTVQRLADAILEKSYASGSNRQTVINSLIHLNGGRTDFAVGVPINIDPAVLVDSEGNTPSFERVIRSLEPISEPLSAGRKLRNPLQTLFPKRFKTEYRAQVAMVTRRAEFVHIHQPPKSESVSENKPSDDSTTVTTLTDADPLDALNKITSTLQPIVPDATVKHSENGSAYVELDLRQASDVVRTQQASAKADKLASAAETAFTNTLSKNSNGVLGATGTLEMIELQKANDAFVQAKKDLDAARRAGDTDAMQKAAEEMESQAKYAIQIAEQSQRKYGRRGKNLERDMRIHAKKQQAAMAEAARKASIAPPPGSVSATIDTPHAYLAKRFGGVMNSSGWMMKIVAATNLLLLAEQISQAKGRQENARAKNRIGIRLMLNKKSSML